MSLNNETQIVNSTTSTSVSPIIIALDLVQQRFVNNLPLIITVLGVVGFIGNAFTFLQPALRSNSFCIYTLCGSFIDVINLFINLFPNYLYPEAGNLASVITVTSVCKLKLFGLVFLPQLSMHLLITSLIDRYACTFGPASPMRHLIQLKTVPWLIAITVIVSGLASIYGPILYEVIPGYGCYSTAPITNAVLYVTIGGIIPPALMLILMFLTYRRFKMSRQRVGAAVVANANRLRNQFVVMAFAQAFVTSFFVLQWMSMYTYFLASQFDNKGPVGWAITYFVLSLTNNLYYFINVRSFYLSTLTSRLFRETLITGLLKLLPGNFYQKWNARNRTGYVTGVTRTQRETKE